MGCKSLEPSCAVVRAALALTPLRAAVLGPSIVARRRRIEAVSARIVAEPAVAVAVPGTRITYRIERGPTIDSPESSYTFEWKCINDPVTAKQRGAPAVIPGPRGPVWESARWDFPGRHKIVCKVQYLPAEGPKPSPQVLEYLQEVRTEKEVLDNAFADARPADYVKWRAGLELEHVDLAQGGVADQSTGIPPYIRCEGANPAVPGVAPDPGTIAIPS